MKWLEALLACLTENSGGGQGRWMRPGPDAGPKGSRWRRAEATPAPAKARFRCEFFGAVEPVERANHTNIKQR